MFIETHGDTKVTLTFIKSLNVKAYPCGRRRSQLIDGSTEDYYIPFDPEARLNTEANNRKHSSTNGYTQTYIRKWDNETLSLVLGGYLFDIKLEGDFTDSEKGKNKFGSDIIANVDSSGSTANKIYANILIEEVPLYTGFTQYYTEVLRNQSSTENPSTSLDLLVSSDTAESDDSNDYYFSGLSFSTKPLTDLTESFGEDQYVVSLCILEKTRGEWRLYNPSLLPKIEHGETENSVKMKTVLVDNLKMPYTNPTDKTTTIRSVPSLNVVETSKGSGVYQLQFAFGKEEEKEN